MMLVCQPMFGMDNQRSNWWAAAIFNFFKKQPDSRTPNLKTIKNSDLIAKIDNNLKHNIKSTNDALFLIDGPIVRRKFSAGLAILEKNNELKEYTISHDDYETLSRYATQQVIEKNQMLPIGKEQDELRRNHIFIYSPRDLFLNEIIDALEKTQQRILLTIDNASEEPKPGLLWITSGTQNELTKYKLDNEQTIALWFWLEYQKQKNQNLKQRITIPVKLPRFLLNKVKEHTTSMPPAASTTRYNW